MIIVGILLALNNCATYNAPQAPLQKFETVEVIATGIRNNPKYAVTFEGGGKILNNEFENNRKIRAYFSISQLAGLAPISNDEVNPSILEFVKTLKPGALMHFNVTMICHVCKDMSPQTKDLALRSDGFSENAANFDFIPTTAGQVERKGNITFSITRGGSEFDFINAPVVVIHPGAQASSRELDNCHMNGFRNFDNYEYDLILHASYGATGDISLSFIPIDDALKAAMGNLIFDERGMIKVFDLYGGSRDSISKQTFETYIHIKSLVEQKAGIYGISDVPKLVVREVFPTH